MIMDGVNIEVGMSVYHLRFGSGQVITVHKDGHMLVRYGRGELTFSQQDLAVDIDKGRLVFWHCPILFAPPASIKVWKALKAMVLACQSVVNQIVSDTK